MEQRNYNNLLNGAGRTASRKKPKGYFSAAKFSCNGPSRHEPDLTDDEIVIEVLYYFFEERISPEQLNDDYRNLAVEAMNRAIQASRLLDFVPRPTGGVPSITWLISQGVKIAFRKIRSSGTYAIVKNPVRAALRTRFLEIKMGISSESQSYRVRAMQNMGQAGGLVISEAGMRLIRQFEIVRGESGINILLPQMEAAVNTAIRVQLSQPQFDALVSFCFSLGEKQFRESTLVSLLNEGNFNAVPDEMRKWIKVNDMEDADLVRRRAAEAELFARNSYAGAQSVYHSYLVFAKSNQAFPSISRAQNPALIIAGAGLGWQIFKGILDNSGDNSWNLSKMEGVKCPNDDAPKYRNKAAFQEFRFEVSRSIESPLTSAISQSADFEVRFSGNGYAIGPVTVQNLRNSDIPTWGLFVDNVMVVNPNNFNRTDGEIMSAVDITFNYRFSNTFVNDAVWIGEYRIFADGRRQVISERWTATAPLG